MPDREGIIFPRKWGWEIDIIIILLPIEEQASFLAQIVSRHFNEATLSINMNHSNFFSCESRD
jgi:hypothetical protein